MSSAVVKSRAIFSHRWLLYQSHKCHRKALTRSKCVGTFCRENFRTQSHCKQRLCVFTISRLHCPCSTLIFNRQFSSSPRRFNEAVATNESISTASSTIPTVDVSSVPEPTSVTTTTDVIETSSHAQWATDAALVAPGDNLSSLGLGGHSPIGLIQSSMEWIHVHTGLPWWASILTCTVILRTALLPIAIKMQANTARMNNIRPETEKLMAKIKHYSRFGHHNQTAIANNKLLELYREHKCSPLKMAITPFIQIPVFISFFIALRRMAAAPVESMKTGGALWFTDLTQVDPYYVLPFCSCGLLLATIELGGEAGVTNPQLEKMKTFFRAFTILLIPITAQFPTALFMYWLPSSLYSIGQILLLKVPAVKSRLGIPEIITNPAQSSNNKGFIEMIKENFRSATIDNDAKNKKVAANKRYKKQLQDKSPKLFDKPPHLR